MNGTISGTINVSRAAWSAEDFWLEIAAIEKAINQLKKKALSFLPARYGSALWWEQSDQRAIEEIKSGRGTVIHNKQELKNFLGV